MIARLEASWRRLQRVLSRNEWTVKLLGLPRSQGTAAERGLVLVQIDGLARTQIEEALRQGRMPYVNRLIKRNGYRMHTFYSGVPSTTPAVQAELFYGVPGAVPSFSFRHPDTGDLVRMFDPAQVAGIERYLSQQGENLLVGGSAYANIYSGGAAEPHYCAATAGWGEVARTFSPWAVASVVVWHGWSVLRTLTLMVVELVLAIVDFWRSPFLLTDLPQELKFLSSRVGVSILLRELATIGASWDVTRGLPVVHLNYLGYDEQAHRRGPSSAFAHWSLRGIDDAISRLASAARRSARRDYDVWVYSDHGQAEVVPFEIANGRPLNEVVAEILGSYVSQHREHPARGGVQTERAAWLGGSKAARLMGSRRSAELATPDETIVAAMGPVAHIYPDREMDAEELVAAAKALVKEGGVPLVLAAGDAGSARAWSARGEFELPRDAADVLGEGHPFLHQAAEELAKICHHPAAGRLVLSGWRVDGPPMSFPIERGAHGGPGVEETRGFALLPGNIALAPPERGYVRAADLRKGAQYVLGRGPLPQRVCRARKTSTPHHLRLTTYNVHGCLGMDGKLSPTRIARVIAQTDADVVALQELDVRRYRSGAIDQAHAIAEELEMAFHFHPALTIEEEQYGDAILSRLPMRLVRAAGLPGLNGRPKLEPRGALWVVVELEDGLEVQLLNTHLGLVPRERQAQIDALLGPTWLGHPECRGPAILCGDLNALPRSPVCRRLGERFDDAQLVLDDHRPQRTWFSGYPVGRIDHVFVSRDIHVEAVDVPRSELARLASDHLPLVVELRVGEVQQGEAASVGAHCP